MIGDPNVVATASSDRDRPFAVGTFVLDDGAPFPGLVVGDDVLDLRPAFGDNATTATLLADWDVSLERMAALAADGSAATMPLATVRALSPVQPTGQVLCAGANYEQHTFEMTFVILRDEAARDGRTVEDDDLRTQARSVIESQREHGRPFMFLATAGALCGASDDVVLWGPGVQHDWELELAVVIGRKAHWISPDEAMDVIAGYTISNDISTRDVMFRPNFGLSDFATSKNRPTFFPTGPYLVPRRFVPDYRDLRISLSVNGETMQDARAGDMMRSVESLVSYASELVELLPGDLVLTGSPGGNAGIHGGRWLRPGDVVVSEITGLGRQENHCVAEAPHHRQGRPIKK